MENHRRGEERRTEENEVEESKEERRRVKRRKVDRSRVEKKKKQQRVHKTHRRQNELKSCIKPCHMQTHVTEETTNQ
jgi:hypothetical protein